MEKSFVSLTGKGPSILDRFYKALWAHSYGLRRFRGAEGLVRSGRCVDDRRQGVSRLHEQGSMRNTSNGCPSHARVFALKTCRLCQSSSERDLTYQGLQLSGDELPYQVFIRLSSALVSVAEGRRYHVAAFRRNAHAHRGQVDTVIDEAREWPAAT